MRAGGVLLRVSFALSGRLTLTIAKLCWFISLPENHWGRAGGAVSRSPLIKMPVAHAPGLGKPVYGKQNPTEQQLRRRNRGRSGRVS